MASGCFSFLTECRMICVTSIGISKDAYPTGIIIALLSPGQVRRVDTSFYWINPPMWHARTHITRRHTHMTPSRRIGFISTRFAGTDGVSLETSKWATVLERLGHECFYFAGQCDRPPQVEVARRSSRRPPARHSPWRPLAAPRRAAAAHDSRHLISGNGGCRRCGRHSG